ncbi:MAG: hypothetical protein ACYCSZ_11585 [Burkholderiales bacterium]
MTIFFSRLKVGYPQPQKEPEDFVGSWKVYTILGARSRDACTTRKDVNELELEDRKKARSVFITLINRAQTGQPLSALYDAKQCHEAFSFDFNGSPFTIYRIRAANIRIYFCYLPNKNIVILKTQPKRKNKLHDGEKGALENIARNVLQYSEPNNFMSRVI